MMVNLLLHGKLGIHEGLFIESQQLGFISVSLSKPQRRLKRKSSFNFEIKKVQLWMPTTGKESKLVSPTFHGKRMEMIRFRTYEIPTQKVSKAIKITDNFISLLNYFNFS